MSNEEAKMMLITMQGLLMVASNGDSSSFIEKVTEAVDIAITAIDTQTMQIENKEEPNGQ